MATSYEAAGGTFRRDLPRERRHRAEYDFAYPLDPLGRLLSGGRPKRRLDQPLGRAEDFRRVGIKGSSPVLPSPRPPPDLLYGLVAIRKFSPPGVGQLVNLLRILQFGGY